MQSFDLVRKAYALHAKGELDAVTQLCAEDMHVEWMASSQNMPFAGSHRGRDVFASHLRTLHELFEYLDFGVVDVVAAEDRVCTRLKIRMRRRAGGAEFVIDGADFWTVRDGKIVAFAEYFDTALAERMAAA